MAEAMPLEIAGETLLLLGDRAVFRPSRARLYLADLHLGKAGIFRRAGIALPTGGTQHDLARIAALVDATRARSVWVLGDFLHGAIDSPQWREGWEAFRDARPTLEFAVLAGNHDRALARAGLDLQLLGDAVEDGALSLRHAPDPHATGHVLCGHVHPTVSVHGFPGRWPAFWLQARTCVMPAFSAFTGGRTPVLAQGDALVACIHGEVLRVV